MEKDELLKRVLMMQRLQGMETEPISAEDPYASMEKDQLISMIHFLVNESSFEFHSRPSCREEPITSPRLCRFHQTQRLKEYVTDDHRY